MKNNKTLYTIQKINKNGEFYGRVHGAMDDRLTTCGLKIDEHWYILTNEFDGEISCPKCMKRGIGEEK